VRSANLVKLVPSSAQKWTSPRGVCAGASAACAAYRPVVSGPLATTREAALAGPSSTTAACSAPATFGWASSDVSVVDAVATYPFTAPFAAASLGTDSPGASCALLASSHGLAAVAFSNSISTWPLAGRESPADVPAFAVAPTVPRGASATNHCG
jgi:hypothetical protein